MNFRNVDKQPPRRHDPEETAEAGCARVGRPSCGSGPGEFLLSVIDRKAKELGVGTDVAPYSPYRNFNSARTATSISGRYRHRGADHGHHRWNALAMVVRANKAYGELGGHIAS